MVSFRDPIHGFIRADPLEAALIDSRPLQRLRSIRQLGFTYLVFPGAEHSRFSHVLGVMDLAGRAYDALALKSEGLLATGGDSRGRRLVRLAALVHDIGHAPFSHSAEERFEGGIQHETMTRRLLLSEEIRDLFDRYGEGLVPADVAAVLHRPRDPEERLLGSLVSGELDVDKMDYLLRDSLYCGVRYGSYDLARLLDTILPIQDPETGNWSLGVEEGGVHALEALVMARYYMFTQVYFNTVGKALELHFNEWLDETGTLWPTDTERFLGLDDVTLMISMRRSKSPHARAVVDRHHFPVAFETREHLTPQEEERFRALLPELRQRFGDHRLLVSHSAKDPHRLRQARLLVKTAHGEVELMEEASQFIRHLGRINRFRVYTPIELRERVAASIEELWR